MREMDTEANNEQKRHQGKRKINIGSAGVTTELQASKVRRSQAKL